MGFEEVEAAIRDIRDGRMVIVVDEEDRENEGDLTMAAEKVTPEAINFMATHGRGLICMPMTGERLDELRIPAMVAHNESPHGTAFCVSIEARRNVSTGISAADRAMTILTAIHPSTRPEDLIRPGHVFPLRARAGGVLERAGQTEAAVDLARLAGLAPAGVICEIMNPDGSMARLEELRAFAAEHHLRIISVVDLIQYRLRTERFVRRLETVPFPCEYGDFQLHLFESKLDGRRHLALVKGDLRGDDPVLVRMHTESILCDVFGSRLLDESHELRTSLRMIEEEGRGVLVYLRTGDREAQLLAEVRDQREGQRTRQEHTTFKEYGIGAQILVDLGLHRVRLLTNHPKRLSGLEAFHIRIEEQIPIRAPVTSGT
ncbi:MAG: bifunctional 3,4-dihydroxy-2-butanone-4-phosphate synthase/GTP cyclohydrolase II [Acidobacteriota bacterium]